MSGIAWAAVFLALALVVGLFRLTPWYRRIKIRWLAFKIAWNLHEMGKIARNINSPDSKLRRARTAIEDLRTGKEFPEWEINQINKAIEAGWNYKDIGTNSEEMIIFRNGGSQKILAQKVLETCRREKDLTNQVSRLAEKGGFSLEEIGTSKAELDAIDRECMRGVYSSYVRHLREIARGEYYSKAPEELYLDICRVLADEGYKYTHEELGTSKEELPELVKTAHLGMARSNLKYMKRATAKGELFFDYEFKGLRESIAKAGAQLEDVGASEDGLRSLARENRIQLAKNNLAKLSNTSEDWFAFIPKDEQYPGNPERFVERLREELSLAGATLKDIYSNEEELAAILKKAYVYSANYLICHLRSVAATPRKTKRERLMALVGPKAMIWPSAEQNVELSQLEEQYPTSRDIAAINYYLEKAGVSVTEVDSSDQELGELASAIQLR